MKLIDRAKAKLIPCAGCRGGNSRIPRNGANFEMFYADLRRHAEGG